MFKRSVRYRSPAGSDAGMTMIELMISITILAVLLGIGVPSFRNWMVNIRVRSVAESVVNGIQIARAEAVRRNTPVRFQLTSAIDNSCTVNTTGPAWVVNLTLTTSPQGLCATAPSDTVAPYIVQTSTNFSNISTVTVAGANSGGAFTGTMAFDGLGRLTTVTNAAVDKAKQTIAFTSSAGTCVAAGGNVRCLSVVVQPAGQVRLCDPAQTNASDPMSCP